MNERYIAYAIPVFLLAMVLELLALRSKKIRGYRFADSVANLGSGIGQQMLDPFLRGLTVLVYGFVWTHVSVTHLDPKSPLTWALAILGVDFFYYWFHRASHRVGFLWAVHSVHHQSDEYNLSVALRQPWLEKLVDVPFYLPLAVVGVPPEVFVAAFTFNLLYQFWIHTRAVGRLGILETTLSTPSHHRVHHGIDPRYVDKNDGTLLIVWDRLFGTFEREDREPAYGTVKPFTSWDPVWANVEPWVALARTSRSAKHWRDKVWLWFAPPEWRPEDLGGLITVPEPDLENRARGPESTGRVAVYVALQLVLGVVALVAFLLHQGALGAVATALAVVLGVLTLTTWGALLEGRRGARWMEVGRWSATALFVAMLVMTATAVSAVAASP